MQNLNVKCALLISTYNWPEALERVLESVTQQTRIPDEVIIADDGSGDATREVIEKFRKDFPCPLIHVWHEDDGFRKCIIWNKALQNVHADYIVQIDGDCVLAPRFIEDHLAIAREGWFTCGSRTLLTQKKTAETLQSRNDKLCAFSSGVLNRVNALRIPILTAFYKERYRRQKPHISRGCNMSFWTKDIFAVNGYNEMIFGWGLEDSDLEVRLMKYGIKRQSLKFGGVQFHLFHKENNRSHYAKNIEIFNAALASDEFWTPNGIVKNKS